MGVGVKGLHQKKITRAEADQEIKRAEALKKQIAKLMRVVLHTSSSVDCREKRSDQKKKREEGAWLTKKKKREH